ncbi:MAG: hypothetical protein IMF17_01770 [Proteobacteria bacterium]|nr:hypothetical protein [Pseudomonadota bacterium]
MAKSILRNMMMCLFFANPLQAFSETEEELSKKLGAFEQRLLVVEQDKTVASSGQSKSQTTNNGFNPAISVILDGVFASYKNNPDDYVLSGYAQGGEAGLAAEGFSLGHSEITLSNNIDDKFFAQLTLAIAEHEGSTEVELEEAFFETLALGDGFSVRGGRFYSAIGYLNQQHEHAWDFQDAPLIYRGLFGNQYFDDGLRLSYIAATDLFLELGTEVFAGGKFPAGGEHSGVGSWTAFVNVGGDIGVSHSWQSGVSYWSADNIEREYGGHDHGGVGEVPLFEGDSHIVGFNAVYKWAPDGNYREHNVKLQFEYFSRDEEGDLTLLNSSPIETSTLNSRQDGWYAQATWQFVRTWSAGIRYDMVDSDNTGSDASVLDEAGWLAAGHVPKRASLMAQWEPSEYSRIRLQYNRDESYPVTDDQLFLQYTFSMGAHGAHQY